MSRNSFFPTKRRRSTNNASTTGSYVANDNTSTHAKIKNSTKRRIRSAKKNRYGYSSTSIINKFWKLIYYVVVPGVLFAGILIGFDIFGDWTIASSTSTSTSTSKVVDQSQSTELEEKRIDDLQKRIEKQKISSVGVSSISLEESALAKLQRLSQPQGVDDDDETSEQKPLEDIFTRLTKKEEQILEKMKNDFKTLKSNGELIPCRLDERDSCFKASGFMNFLRKPTGTYRMLLHNPLPEDRFYCGKRILGGGGTLEVKFPDQCNDNGSLAYVYSKRPPTLPKTKNKSSAAIDVRQQQQQQQQPVELFWNSDKSSGKDFPCPIPCKTNEDYDTVNEINVRNTNWTITLSMEGYVSVKALAYRKNQFYATTSFQSEIPVPYFSWKEYKIQHHAVDFQKAIKGASFLANNCATMNKRENFVSELIDKTELRVDSLSSCVNNAEPPPGADMKNKTAVMAQYLFHLAFENSNVDDYITEKLWGALESGSLPVYLGAKNIKERVPANSIIVAEDFDSPKDLAEYLIRLTNDKTLYESYHTWRYQPIDTAFADQYEFTNTHSTCRICKWVYAKRHGLGWNHTKQEVIEPYIGHKTCRNKMGLIGHPFKEYWLPSSLEGKNDKLIDDVHIMSADHTKSCTLSDVNRIIEIDHGAIRRKVYDHDGVTDMIIDRTENRDSTDHYILRFQTPIVSSNQPHRMNDSVWWLQDSRSRIYVMASGGDISLSTHKLGMFEILISSSNIARVRIFTENVDHFHQKTKKTPSYFGDLMIRDFFEPIESYRI